MSNETGTPGLEELRRELEAVGMVVVPFRDEVHVRRSTLEYIRVRVDDGVLRCEPCVGIMSQARTTWALVAAEVVAIPTLLLHFGITPLGLLAAFTGLLGFSFHALPYTLSEIAVNRIQSVWLSVRAAGPVALPSLPMAMGSATKASLPADADDAPPMSKPDRVQTLA